MKVRGTLLQPCSERKMPPSGYTRDGICRMHRGTSDRTTCVCLRDIDKGRFCEGCDAFDNKCDATHRLALDHYERARERPTAYANSVWHKKVRP